MLAGTEAWLLAAWPAGPSRPGAGGAGTLTGLGALHLLHALVAHNGVRLPRELVQVLPPSPLSGRRLAPGTNFAHVAVWAAVRSNLNLRACCARLAAWL